MMRKEIFLFLFFAAVILPREAVVLQTSGNGAGWAETGEISLPFGMSCRRMETELDRGGWKAKDWFTLPGQKKVAVWEKDGEKITVMIWEKELKKCGFSWGKLKTDSGKGGNHAGRK